MTLPSIAFPYFLWFRSKGRYEMPAKERKTL